jgi:hypothetical protein
MVNKLCKEDLNYSLNIVRGTKSSECNGWACNTQVKEMRNMYKILVSKPEEKVQLQRHRRIWEYTFKMGIKRIRSVAWIGSAYIPLTSTCEHGNTSSDSVKGWTFIG